MVIRLFNRLTPKLFSALRSSSSSNYNVGKAEDCDLGHISLNRLDLRKRLKLETITFMLFNVILWLAIGSLLILDYRTGIFSPVKRPIRSMVIMLLFTLLLLAQYRWRLYPH